MGRLVKTHSTYIEGLIPWLKQLSKQEGISTVTPGEIRRSRGKAEGLQIRISIPIKGGFKLISRKGNVVQEVFVTTHLDIDLVQELIIRSKP